MAIQADTRKNSIRKWAAKSVPLALLMAMLFYPLYLISQSPIQELKAMRRNAAFAIVLSWFQTCHRQVTTYWSPFPATQYFGVLQRRSTQCPHTCPMDHKAGTCLGCLGAGSSKVVDMEAAYSQPNFPYNILPGSVELTCQDFSGYAFERCKIDVTTRTQLFIALVSVFCFVILCVVLVTMLTWVRRMKSRRKHRRLSLIGNTSRQTSGMFIPPSKRKGRVFRIKSPRRGIRAAQSSNREEAVEAEEQGFADQDIPITLDGVTDGWMQWIRQRANMQMPGNSPHQPTPNDTLPNAPSTPMAKSSAPRIPSLKLPRPTLTAFRKTGGLDPELGAPSSQSVRGTGKGKEKLKVRWNDPV